MRASVVCTLLDGASPARVRRAGRDFRPGGDSMSAVSARREARALLRSHLATIAGRRHLARHCPLCHRLLRLALGPSGGGETADGAPAG
ncbi:DUF6274 family protein [Streptomyces sp. NPDC046821]|uniref:DUF6274 family protein n=1 Tax=Streptomyces sp. NPDC046821 TaxID=3154702 RepID=UPI0033DE4CC9